ncbi:hypothetical protein HOLleu_43197 [Holothuria leucospilota]|uniref:Uncharacterized protein n=1 Tax=Holothuria leucospilota TaxID=206669 RepID=A0A9Q0YAX7_HOLLE|nr:hypothetical protein HOLleu_43197 [Holothuria leucospilota]
MNVTDFTLRSSHEKGCWIFITKSKYQHTWNKSTSDPQCRRKVVKLFAEALDEVGNLDASTLFHFTKPRGSNFSKEA